MRGPGWLLAVFVSLAGAAACSGGPAPTPTPSKGRAEVRRSALTSDVTVTVLDGDGNPIAGQDVVALDSNGDAVGDWPTDDQAQVTLSLDPDTYAFSTRFAGTDFYSDDCTVPGCTAATVQISKAVLVTVTDGYGNPRPDAPIVAIDTDDDQVLWDYTDDLGHVSAYLRPGAYFFRATMGSYFDSGPSGSCVIPGCTSASIEVTDVMVTLTEGRGNPIPDEQIAAVAPDGTQVAWAYTDDQGHADVFVNPGAFLFRAVIDGNYFDSGPDGHCVVPGCRTAFIGTPPPVVVTVVDGSGQPVANQDVFAINSNGYGPDGTTDAEGHVTFTLGSDGWRFSASCGAETFFSGDAGSCQVPGCTAPQIKMICGACAGRPDGTACDDGNACTQTDLCAGGACLGTDGIDCTASDQCHDVGACVASTGMCTNPAKDDGTACNDGNACTQTDTCQAGVCTGANPMVCTGGDQCHTGGGCNPSTGACSSQNAPDPSGIIITPVGASATSETPPRQDNLGRPALATIDGSGLASATPATFSGMASLPKHNEGAEAPTPVLWMSAYNVLPTTQAPVSITFDLGSVQTVNALLIWNYAEVAYVSATSAGVSFTSRGAKDVNLYASASDSNPQTLIQQVTFDRANPNPQGFSSNVAGPAAQQLDYNTAPDVYKLISPVSARYVRFEIISNYGDLVGVGLSEVRFGNISFTSCNDGSACTQADMCQGGVCTGVNPVVCAAQDQCHGVGTCDSSTGACSAPRAPDGLACDDGNRCSSGDSCRAGTCLPGATNVCSAPGQTNYVSVIDVGSAQGLSYATGINNSGLVVGSDVPAAAGVYQRGYPGSRGFRWSESGGMVYVPWAGAQSYADSINDAGVTSVSAGTDPGALFPCRYDPAVDAQPVCQNNPGFSTGINAAGTVTGWISQPGGHWRMFRLGVGSIEILPSTPSDADSYGTWIDADGSVVAAQPATGAVRYTAARGTEVLANLLPADSDWSLSNPAYIRSGEIGGWGVHAGLERAFRIRTTASGDVSAISALPMPSTFEPDAPVLMAADASNAAGEIVGTIWDSAATWPKAAFVYTDAIGSVDLNTLIDPQSGWTLLAAWAINSGHQVVGFGLHGGVYHGYKLTLPDLSPCPPADSCHASGTRDLLTGACSNSAKPDGSACDDGNPCTQEDVCTAGTCRGATAFTCVALDTCHDAGTCNPAAPTPSPPSTEDLIGWWKLDGDGKDASGVGHDLTIEGGVTPAPGRVGLGMKFDGTGCMTTPVLSSTGSPVWDAARMQGATGVTMMAWFSDSELNVCPFGDESIMSRGWDYVTAVHCYTAGPGPAPTGEVRFAGALGWGYPGGVGQIPPNTWTHVAITWDHQDVFIYRDGQLVGTNHDPGEFGDIESTFALGCMISKYFTGDERIQHFVGTLDDAMLYRRVLSPQEIWSYYVSAFPCDRTTFADGAACNDGNFCTQGDTCHAGSCVGGAPVTCTPPDSCHDAATCLWYAGCYNPPVKPDGTACSDGNACTRSDSCQAGACVGADPVQCVASDTCHGAGTCDQATGVCTNPPLPAGTCENGTFDYDKAGRLVHDRGARLEYDAYDQLRKVTPAAVPAPQQLQGARIEKIGDLGGTNTSPRAMNRQGQIAGYTLFSNVGHAFLQPRTGPPLDINAAAGVTTTMYGLGINDAGTVAGNLYDAAGAEHVFLYNQATGLQDLGVNNPTVNVSYINNEDQIAGTFNLPNSGSHAALYTPGGGWQDIGTLPGGTNSFALAVDDLGDVLGASSVPGTPTTGFDFFGHAFFFNDVVGIVDLNNYVDPTLGWTLVTADRFSGDWVAGVVNVGGRDHGYRLKLSTHTVEPITAWDGDSYGYGINSYGEVVGDGFLDAGNTHKTAWFFSDQYGIVDLTQLIDPALGWDLQFAFGINDAGDVIGWGYLNGVWSAYVLHLPLRTSTSGAPTVAEAHTYGYDGLRTSTRTSPGPNQKVQLWFTQDYTEHDGIREHYVRVGNRLISRVTTQPNPPAGMGTVRTEEPTTNAGPGNANIVGGLALLLAALSSLILGVAKRRRRWVPGLAGLASLLLVGGSCEMLGFKRGSHALDWHVAPSLTHYFHQGIAPGPNLITDSVAAKVEERRYEPFGQPIPTIDVVSEPQNILGKVTDPNTGWSYHGARWMQPQTARWTSPDPAIKGPEAKHLLTPWDLNAYQYVHQSPTLFWDPDGQDLAGASLAMLPVPLPPSENAPPRYKTFVNAAAHIPVDTLGGVVWFLCLFEACADEAKHQWHDLRETLTPFKYAPKERADAKDMEFQATGLMTVGMGVLAAPEAALAPTGEAIIESSAVIPASELSSLPAAAVGEDLVILGPFSRRVSLEIGGVVRTGRIDTWETVLHPLAARLGGRTLKGFPGTIEAMAPHIQAADRIVFFTAPKLGPLTSEEMALIQSSDAFRLKSTFVYGGID